MSDELDRGLLDVAIGAIMFYAKDDLTKELMFADSNSSQANFQPYENQTAPLRIFHQLGRGVR